jgi:hypothetical protein
METSRHSESYSSVISSFDNYEAKTEMYIAMSINQNKLVYFFKCMIVFDLNKSKLTSLSKISILWKQACSVKVITHPSAGLTIMKQRQR